MEHWRVGESWLAAQLSSLGLNDSSFALQYSAVHYENFGVAGLDEMLGKAVSSETQLCEGEKDEQDQSRQLF